MALTGAVCIAGIFTTPGIIWKTVGSPGITLLLFIFGGIISMFGSLCYVEVGELPFVIISFPGLV
jgi:amino acid transporter